MNAVHRQEGNPELTSELSGLSFSEVSARCSDILASKTIPVDRLALLLDNMTRAVNRVREWSPATAANFPASLRDVA